MGGGRRADARAPGVGGGAAADDYDEAAERAAEPLLHAAIEASGLQQEAARRFGAQGEGAIAGRWLEYSVTSLDEHHRFRYSRLACDRGADGERAAAALIMGTTPHPETRDAGAPHCLPCLHTALPAAPPCTAGLTVLTGLSLFCWLVHFLFLYVPLMFFFWTLSPWTATIVLRVNGSVEHEGLVPCLHGWLVTWCFRGRCRTRLKR